MNLPNLRIPSDKHLSHFRPNSSSIYTGVAIIQLQVRNQNRTTVINSKLRGFSNFARLNNQVKTAVILLNGP